MKILQCINNQSFNNVPLRVRPPTPRTTEARHVSTLKGQKKSAAGNELTELADRYLAWLVATRYSPETIKGAATDLEWFLRYLGTQGIERIADVTEETLGDYSLRLREQRNMRHEDRKISLSHVSHRLGTLRQFFRWLVEEMHSCPVKIETTAAALDI